MPRLEHEKSFHEAKKCFHLSPGSRCSISDSKEIGDTIPIIFRVLPVEFFVMIAVVLVIGIVVRSYSGYIVIFWSFFCLRVFLLRFWDDTCWVTPLPIRIVCRIDPYAIRNVLLLRFLFIFSLIFTRFIVDPIFLNIFILF